MDTPLSSRRVGYATLGALFSSGGLASLVRATPGHPKGLTVALGAIGFGVVCMIAALRGK